MSTLICPGHMTVSGVMCEVLEGLKCVPVQTLGDKAYTAFTGRSFCEQLSSILPETYSFRLRCTLDISTTSIERYPDFLVLSCSGFLFAEIYRTPVVLINFAGFRIKFLDNSCTPSQRMFEYGVSDVSQSFSGRQTHFRCSRRVKHSCSFDPRQGRGPWRLGAGRKAKFGKVRSWLYRRRISR